MKITAAVGIPRDIENLLRALGERGDIDAKILSTVAEWSKKGFV